MRQNAPVFFLDIAEAESEARTASLQGAVTPSVFLPCNLKDPAAIAQIEAAAGAVQVLVNNAANDDRRELGELSVHYCDYRTNVRAELGEGASWLAGAQGRVAVYCVDIKGPGLHHYAPATGERQSGPAPLQAGVKRPVQHDGGSWVCGLSKGLAHLDEASGEFSPLARVTLTSPLRNSHASKCGTFMLLLTKMWNPANNARLRNKCRK